MESSGAIIDRIMREQQKQIQELQEQNKQLIEVVISVATMQVGPQNWGIAVGIMQTKAQYALQQIQGKDDER